MSITRIVEPAVEPVSIDDVKLHLVIDADMTTDDDLLTAMIVAARDYAESYCKRSFITQQWLMELDSFGDSSAAADVPYQGVIQFERAPVQSIDTITYVDMSGNTQTITKPGTPQQTATLANETKFALSLRGAIARLSPAFGYIWPIPLPQIGAVTISYTTGYGATGDLVPQGIRNWIKLRVATLYQNREEVAVMPRGKVEALPYVDKLLDPYVVQLA